jgi:phosphohistidine swiveling domain-containing protein
LPAYVVPLSRLDSGSSDLAGPKAANLGELMRAGVPVPDGFCLTTRAFGRFFESAGDTGKLLATLADVAPGDLAGAAEEGAAVRAALGELPVPDDVRAELLGSWRDAGQDLAYAVRSSGTAEDLPGLSFAGQHDTYLNVRGEKELLRAVRECWLSLFTDRAISYRARHGVGHEGLGIAVVVQRMVLPSVSGVMFTADPVTSDRHTIVINAAYGVGETVVAGLVTPDLYRIGRDGTLRKTISDKKLAVVPLPSGGVAREEIPEEARNAQALADEAIRELAAMGRTIEGHFGSPQDIEWAWADDRLSVLQARPVTSLFPLPDRPRDDRLHVYFSFGHQQMMTDAIKPLGSSVVRTFFPFGRRLPDLESSQMVLAGNRVFFDYTEGLHPRLARRLLAWLASAMDKRVGVALREVSARASFRAHHRFNPRRDLVINVFIFRALARVAADLCWTDMAAKRERTRRYIDRLLADSEAAIAQAHGADRVARVQADLRSRGRAGFQVMLSQVTAMTARNLIERWCKRWLGDTDDMPALGKALPGNVTTEMALEIGDLADLARGKPGLLALLQSPPAPFTADVLDTVPDGAEFREALTAFLGRYGMRGSGEIDITRPRWGEDPASLFPAILANTRSGRPGEHRERFRAGEAEAEAAAGRIRDRARATRFGRLKAAVLSRLITVYRTLMGLREHQKLLTASLYSICRTAIRAEAEGLAEAGLVESASDVDFLSLNELRLLVAGQAPPGLKETIRDRKKSYETARSLTPPRLYTSDGEVLGGSGPGQDGAGALAGSPVSPGLADGTARVVLRPEDAMLRDGDILVAPYTDPAWTPLFSAVRGIVLEIGGMMSHGAVVARELGLPAVAGVDGATRLIRDGSRIRVDGSRGVVERAGDR